MVSDELFDLLAKIISNVLLFLLVFGMSATVDSKDLIAQLNNKHAIIAGIFMQYMIMPFLGFFTLKLFGYRIPPTMGLILLVVTSSPGGSYSNWWCSLFNADLALSVAMTTFSTLLSTLLLPVNLLIYVLAAYGNSNQDAILDMIQWSALFYSLTIVMIAILAGFTVSHTYQSKKLRRLAYQYGSLSGLLLVICSILMNVMTQDNENSEVKVWEQDWSFYAGVSLPCILGLVLSNFVSYAIKLSHPERVTLSVECCYQNVGIATSVAIAMFNDNQERAEALNVPLFYGLVEAIVIGFYCSIAWKKGWTKAPKDEKFCVMLLNTYEVDEENIVIDDVEQLRIDKTEWKVTTISEEQSLDEKKDETSFSKEK